MSVNSWSAKQLVLACVLVGLLSGALGAGIILWVFVPSQQPEQDVFHAVPPPSTPPPASISAAPLDPLLAGNAFYDRQQWAEAIASYQQAIAGGRDNANLRTDLGNCYRFTRQPAKALIEYQRAQTIDPQHELSLYNQITLYDEDLHDQPRVHALVKDFETRFPQSENLAAVRKHLH